LFLFVLAGDCGGYFLVLLVYGLDGDGCALFGFAVQLVYLLFLDGGQGHLHTEDDVADLELGEAADVYVVLFCVVVYYEVLQLHLAFDPLLICQCRPDMVGFRHDSLMRFEYRPSPINIHVQCPQNQYNSREGSIALY
jgi:hypothetical protein